MLKRHLCLVDGSGFIFRAFYSLPPLTRADGTPVNAVLGFCNMLHALSEEVAYDAMAVLFDTKHPTFRHKLFSDYKANRDAPPEELVPQFSLIREATKAFGFPAIELAGYEADDLIATYARMAVEGGWRVSIVSSDKDLMQLVRSDVGLIDPKSMNLVGPEQVKAKFGVLPDCVVDVQALAGDSTDNVPGIRGIGLKTAAQLINEYGTLDELLSRAAEIKQPKRREALVEQAEAARLSRELVRLKDDVPVEEEWSTFEKNKLDSNILREFLIAQNFKSLLRRLEKHLGGPSIVETISTENTEQQLAPEYELVQELEELQKWVGEAKSAGAVVIDTETTSLDAMTARLVGISLAITPARACYIPLLHVEPGSGDSQAGVYETLGEQIPIKKALDVLRPLLEDPSVLKIGQNLKYDMLVLRKDPYCVRLYPIDDTMVMSFVLDAGRGSHGMDELSKRYLDVRPIAYKDVVGSGKQQITFDKVPLVEACEYAAEDADITLRLYEKFKPRLLQECMTSVYEVLERPLAGVLVEMEAAGIEVFNHGSGETLATSIAAAYDDKKPWFGYYWGPTAVLGKYPMKKLSIGKIDAKIHSANQNKGNPNPGVSDFPPAPVLTVVTAAFKKREPAVVDLMSKVSFDVSTMNGLLAWKKDKKASAEEAAVRFLKQENATWSKWVSADARKKLSSILK